MKRTANPSWRNLTKSLAFALALLLFLFLLQVTTPHRHAKGQNEAACRLCHVAHLGVAPAVAASTLTLPLVAVGRVVADGRIRNTILPCVFLFSRTSYPRVVIERID
jgi:hypothetical protein